MSLCGFAMVQAYNFVCLPLCPPLALCGYHQKQNAIETLRLYPGIPPTHCPFILYLSYLSFCRHIILFPVYPLKSPSTASFHPSTRASDRFCDSAPPYTRIRCSIGMPSLVLKKTRFFKNSLATVIPDLHSQIRRSGSGRSGFSTRSTSLPALSFQK